MTNLKIINDKIIRADGSSFDRNLLTEAYYGVDYSIEIHRNKPGWWGPLLAGVGLLVIYTINNLEDKSTIAEWPIGNATIPLSYICIILGVYLSIRSITKSRKLNHIRIFVKLENAQPEILSTNDKSWADKTVIKLRTLSDTNKGDWIINSQEKSFTQR